MERGEELPYVSGLKAFEVWHAGEDILLEVVERRPTAFQEVIR
jgi:hypothetical protein